MQTSVQQDYFPIIPQYPLKSLWKTLAIGQNPLKKKSLYPTRKIFINKFRHLRLTKVPLLPFQITVFI